MAAEIYACLKTIQSCVINKIILHYSCHLKCTDRHITVLIEITPDMIECLWDDLVCVSYGLDPVIMQREITESNYDRIISELFFVFKTRTRGAAAAVASDAALTYKPVYPLDERFDTEDAEAYTFPKTASENLATFVEAFNELRCLLDLPEMPNDEIKYKTHKSCVSLVWSRKDAKWGIGDRTVSL